MSTSLLARTGAVLGFGLFAPIATAQEIVLYENDFERPNQPIEASCGNSLDQSGINACYGQAGFSFIEQFSVETIVLHDSGGRYANQGDDNGRYAIGMLGSVQDDWLALRFDVQSQRFLNVTMDVSSIDVDGCGGPFGVETPRFALRVLDNPDGIFDWNDDLLDEKTLEGVAAPNAWSFGWSRATIALDASKATNGTVILVFDLVSEGYAALDNLKITATRVAAVADRDEDGVEDDTDNCPATANGNQSNNDGDLAGDACDPAPMNPNRCGDRSGDGEDDCQEFCMSRDVPSCEGAGTAGSAAAGRGASGRGSRGGADGSEIGSTRSPQLGDGEDAGADEDDDRPSRIGGGGPSGSRRDEPEVSSDGGCTSLPGRGNAAPWGVCALGLAVLVVWRRRRR